MLTTADLGDVRNAGPDDSYLKTLKKNFKTFKVSSKKLKELQLKQKELLNYKKESGKLFSISSINESEGVFYINSHDFSLDELRNNINKDIIIEELNFNMIDNLIKKSLSSKDKKSLLDNFLKDYKEKISDDADSDTIFPSFINPDENPIKVKDLYIGQKVWVISGPKRGCTGIIKEMETKNKIQVLLEDYRMYYFNFKELKPFSNLKSWSRDTVSSNQNLLIDPDSQKTNFGYNQNKVPVGKK